ncbi:hypothetical protein [Rickettsiella massiliensis]|uniref:hypothetical protein n=1 Tax=Rickettsiella massiliensis TaxID=676517 RepID=UPI000299F83C|nr:hypothetical protein [Rickettsiella massiliensis]
MPSFSSQLKKRNSQRRGSYTLPHLSDSTDPSFRSFSNYEWDSAYPNRQQQLAELRGELNRSKCRIYNDEFLQVEEINALLRAPFPRPIQEEIWQEIRTEQALHNTYVRPGGGAINNEPLYEEIMPVNQALQTAHSEQGPYVNYDVIYELAFKKALGLESTKISSDRF